MPEDADVQLATRWNNNELHFHHENVKVLEKLKNALED